MLLSSLINASDYHSRELNGMFLWYLNILCELYYIYPADIPLRVTPGGLKKYQHSNSQSKGLNKQPCEWITAWGFTKHNIAVSCYYVKDFLGNSVFYFACQGGEKETHWDNHLFTGKKEQSLVAYSPGLVIVKRSSWRCCWKTNDKRSCWKITNFSRSA